MFNKLFEALKTECGIFHFSHILQKVEEMIALVGEEYVKDGNMRNAALDAIVEIIQKHKINPPST